VVLASSAAVQMPDSQETHVRLDVYNTHRLVWFWCGYFRPARWG